MEVGVLSQRTSPPLSLGSTSNTVGRPDRERLETARNMNEAPAGLRTSARPPSRERHPSESWGPRVTPLSASLARHLTPNCQSPSVLTAYRWTTRRADSGAVRPLTRGQRNQLDDACATDGGLANPITGDPMEPEHADQSTRARLTRAARILISPTPARDWRRRPGPWRTGANGERHSQSTGFDAHAGPHANCTPGGNPD